MRGWGPDNCSTMNAVTYANLSSKHGIHDSAVSVKLALWTPSVLALQQRSCGSNFRSDIGYHDEFGRFTQSLHTYARIGPEISPWTLPSAFFLIIHLLSSNHSKMSSLYYWQEELSSTFLLQEADRKDNKVCKINRHTDSKVNSWSSFYFFFKIREGG
jgi:hypothetical protein